MNNKDIFINSKHTEGEKLIKTSFVVNKLQAHLQRQSLLSVAYLNHLDSL